MARTDVQRVLGLLATAGLLAACESSVVAPPGTPPASVQIISGDSQSGTVGTALPQALAARVLDALGRPIPGQLVNFRVTAGGGSVFAGAGITNDTGLVQERWTLGTSTADSQRVEVRAVNNATGAPLVLAVFQATPLPGPATALAKTSGDGQSGPLGVALAESLVVKLTDRYGNPAPGDTIAWAVTVGGGSVSPARTATNSAGVATAHWLLGNRLDTTNVATATRAGISPAAFTASPQLPSNATVVVTGGDAQTGVVGTALAESVAVKVSLAGTTPVAGAPVTWSAPGSFTPQPSLTDTAGVARVVWTLGPTAGPQTGSAKISDASAVSFAATAEAGPPDTLRSIQGNLQVAAPSQAPPESLVVKVLDRFGNPVPDASVTWSVTGGGGSVSPSSAVTESSGRAPAQWTLGPSGSQRLTASVAGAHGSPVTFRAGLTSSQPLQVRITAPLHASVARPSVSVTAECEPGRCFSIELRYAPKQGGLPGGVADTSEGDTLSTPLSLGDYDGFPVQLLAVARGFLGDTTSDTATVYVELSSALTQVADVPGEIWEAQVDRILYRQDSAGISLLKIRDRPSGTDQLIMGEAGKFPRYGFLTALGAMFVEGSGEPTAAELYEWRSGVLSDLNQVSTSSLNVRGQYAIWTTYPGNQLTQRDITAGTNVALVTNVTSADVASNGDVVYSCFDTSCPNTLGDLSALFRFRSGTTTQLTGWSCIANPVTDGTNVAFVKADAVCKGGSLYLYDPGGDIVLTSNRDYRSSYAANDGWLTYTEFDANSVPQIWTRSPTGQTRQVPAVTSAGASEKRLDSLGPGGALTFLCGNQWVGWQRFLAKPTDTGAPVGISWSLGRAYWINGELFLAIGRSLFKVQ